MSFSDETLMAYADGELDVATRRAVEQACSTDLALARRVAYYKTRRSNVFAGFAPGDDGQRVPQDWKAADARELVDLSMHAGQRTPIDPVAADMDFYFSPAACAL